VLSRPYFGVRTTTPFDITTKSYKFIIALRAGFAVENTKCKCGDGADLPRAMHARDKKKLQTQAKTAVRVKMPCIYLLIYLLQCMIWEDPLKEEELAGFGGGPRRRSNSLSIRRTC
jgi:hypothetical protein